MANEADLGAIKLLLIAILITLLGWWSIIGAIIGILLFLYALAILILKIDNVLKISVMRNLIVNSRRQKELKQSIRERQSLGYETPELDAELEFLQKNRFKRNTYRSNA